MMATNLVAMAMALYLWLRCLGDLQCIIVNMTSCMPPSFSSYNILEVKGCSFPVNRKC